MLLDQPLEGEAVALLRATSSSSGSIPVKILIWHGYLLGRTSSNVYELARTGLEPPRARGRRLRPGAASGAVRPGRRRLRPAGCGPHAPGLRPRPLRGLEPRLLPEPRLPSATSGSSGTPPPCGSTAGRPPARQPRPPRCASRRRHGRPVRGQGARVKSEFAIRGNEELAAWARKSLADADDVLAGSEHIRRVLEEVVGPDGAGRVRVVPPGRHRRASAGAARPGARTARRGGPT